MNEYINTHAPTHAAPPPPPPPRNHHSPIQHGLRDRVGVAVRPARVLEDAGRAAVLLEVLVRYPPGEDRFAVIGVRFDGRHGSAGLLLGRGGGGGEAAAGGGSRGGPGQEGAGGGGGC